MRRFRGLAALAAVVVVATVLAGVAPRTAVAAMPGERTLSETQIQSALAALWPEEREYLAAKWADRTKILPVGFTLTYYDVRLDDQGRQELVPIYQSRETSEDSALVLPDTRLAGTGTGGRYELAIAIWIGRTNYSGYEWQVEASFDWANDPFPPHMNVGNRSEDMMGVSWAGNLAIDRDNRNVYMYQPSCDGATQGYIYRSDVTPNEGIGWSFRESAACAAVTFEHVDRGRGGVYIRETSWKSTSSNIAMKYVHTYAAGDVSYSLSFTNASISYSPTAETWSAAAYTTFSH